MDPKITHVIFDVDGLILDTEKLYTRILENMLEKYDKKFTWELKLKQMGKREQDSAKIAIDELNLPITVEQYLDEMHKGQAELFPKADLLPGAEKLIKHLHKHKIPIAVATGSDTHSYGLKRQSHSELFDLFHHEVLASSDPEVHHGKPAPDVFLVAANRFEKTPENKKQCLVFEDAPNGVQSALSAGMKCVWVPDSNVNKFDWEVKLKGVDLILSSLEEFIPEDFGLPPY